MKRKICIGFLTLSSAVMIVLAADVVDKCTEKFNACNVTCGNLYAQCKARGSTDCDNRFSSCKNDCNKDLKKCQEKAGIKPNAPQPKPSAKPKK
jgi:hypothetical protein